MKFKVGDIVELKSGGPEMTVNGFAANGKCVCSWFAAGEARTEQFFPDALELVEGK